MKTETMIVNHRAGIPRKLRKQDASPDQFTFPANGSFSNGFHSGRIFKNTIFSGKNVFDLKLLFFYWLTQK